MAGHVPDVLVIGGGNAGLCAALAGRAAGASVLLLEAAPPETRGGNTRHARNLRVAHDAPDDFVRGAYPAEEFFADLWRATGGASDPCLARHAIGASADLLPWMLAHGARFQPLSSPTLPPSRKTAFLLGGGMALLNAYGRTAARRGVAMRHNAAVTELHLEAGRVTEAILRGGETLRPRAVVLAEGGAQANAAWLLRQFGPRASGFVNRGTPHAQGNGLFSLLAQGADVAGRPASGHFVPVDARGPPQDGGIVTRLGCAPYCIVVDQSGQRVAGPNGNAGEKLFAAWGDVLARCPGQRAFAIFDAAAAQHFRLSIYPPVTSDSLAGLAAALGIAPQNLARSIGAALSPPFSAYPLRPGLTFVHAGLRVDSAARVLLQNGCPVPNLFAAGQVMAGSVLGSGYLAGLGLTLGSVFGRIAGAQAARAARA